MKKYIILLIVTSTLFVNATVQAADRYWVSFQGIGTGIPAVYLMQIDSTGKILVPPTAVIPFPNALFLMSAISNGGPGELYIWGIGPDPLNPGPASVRQSIINTTNLTASAVQKFPILPPQSGASFSLAASQNVENKFIAFQRKTSLKAFGISSTDTFDGRKFRISPRTSGSFFSGGVSADGRMAWTTAAFSAGDKLYLQPLRADGLPVGTPRVAGGSTKTGLTATADVSNLLPNGTRLAVYYNIDGPSNPASIYSQIVDGTTGAKIGGRQIVASFLGIEPFIFFNGLLIDPNAQFVLEETESTCGGTHVFLLAFQALDSTGAPKGSPIQIPDCDFVASSGIEEVLGPDIMEIQ